MKKSVKLILEFCLLSFLCFGCGKKEDAAGNLGNMPGEQAMGRYIEEEQEFPESIAASAGIVEMQDGSLAVLDSSTGAYWQKDGDTVWKEGDSPLSSQRLEGTFVINAAIAPDESCAVIYSIENPESEIGYSLRYLYIFKDGEETELEFDMDYDKENYIQYIWFSPDNRLFASSIDEKVYEVNIENSSLKLLFDTENEVYSMSFQNTLMIGLSKSEVYLYDMEKKTLMERDALLDEFVGKQNEAETMIITPAKESQVIYLACGAGLYRYVLYGNTMEQAINGGLCTFGDPNYQVISLLEQADGKYLVFFSGSKLIKYVFDKDIPTVPEKELVVFSLEENKVIRQAVSSFQKKNQDLYVKYEIGVTNTDGTTKEDAIKKLNTELLAGKGADILVLDDMPVSSLTEKGLLADMSTAVSNISAENSLLKNIVQGYEQEGKIYMLPARFRIPMIVGPSRHLEQITDLKSLADELETIRRDNSDGSIMRLYKEQQVLELLGMVSGSTWINENGEIDKAALSEFLTQAKRIYQTEQSGVTEEDIQVYENDRYYNGSSMLASGEKPYYLSIQPSMSDFYLNNIPMAAGYVEGMMLQFTAVTSAIQEKEGVTFREWNGQQQNTLPVNTVMAVSAKAQNSEAAEEFIVQLFTESWMDDSNGFPIGEKSFENCFVNPLEENLVGSMMFDDMDGKSVVLDCYWPAPEDIKKLKNIAEAGIPYMENSTVNETVYSIGEKALTEEISIEEAVEEICRKLSIYLAE